MKPSRRRVPPKTGGRSNVGLMNPFPLTEAILKKRIPWEKTPPEVARSLIGEALGMDYASLFDPRNRSSPLYAGLPRQLCPIQRLFYPLVRILRSLIGRNRPPNPAPRRQAPGTFATGAPPPCAASVTWPPVAQGIYPEPPPPAEFNEPKVQFGTHPLQGCAADCYFIAALSSIAWNDPTLLTGYSEPGGNHSFTLWNVGPDLTPYDTPAFTIDRSLPVDANGSPAFGHSNEPGLIWPALHEKAYAVFRGIGPAATPDITALSYGNPLQVLCNISWYNGWFYLTSDFYDPVTRKFDGQRAFGEINYRCGGSDIGNKSRYPMVALTYLDPPPELDFAYTNDLVAGNHSYSILGTWVDGGTQYIILRNPFGLTVAPPIRGVKGGSWPYDDWYCQNGEPYLDSYDRKKMDLLAPPGNPGAGVFAMEVGEFLKYFEAFGWVE